MKEKNDTDLKKKKRNQDAWESLEQSSWWHRHKIRVTICPVSVPRQFKFTPVVPV